jgi:hypothetical protein
MPEGDPQVIEWQIRVADRRPGATWVIGGVAVVVLFVGSSIGGIALGAVGATLILLATGEYWVGRKFKLDEQEASAGVGPSVNVLAWDKIQRVIIQNDSVVLTALAKESKLDNIRGVHLRTLPENHEAVIGYIRSHCNTDVRFLGE